MALRGLFIVDPDGILRQSTINDLPVGRSVDETLRLIQAFQYHAKHGDVCPAGWTPGQEAMSTSQDGLKKVRHSQPSSLGLLCVTDACAIAFSSKRTSAHSRSCTLCACFSAIAVFLGQEVKQRSSQIRRSSLATHPHPLLAA